MLDGQSPLAGPGAALCSGPAHDDGTGSSSGCGARTSPARALERRGYAILHRRYRTRYGELDIVAAGRATCMVFVEVKARGTADSATAAEPSRRRNSDVLRRWRRTTWGETPAADRLCRFDVVAVDRVEPPRVTVYPDAFGRAVSGRGRCPFDAIRLPRSDELDLPAQMLPDRGCCTLGFRSGERE